MFPPNYHILMKNLFLVTFLISACFQSCNEESLAPGTEKIQFSFSVNPKENSGGRTTSDLPEGVTLLISLADQAGNAVFTHHRLNILRLGDTYISAPLELTRGNYKVTDFMLVDASSEVLYATPHRGSPLAKVVKHPLPRSFGVGVNSVKNVPMEVIDVQEAAPEDFGYASFQIALVHPWRISVFVFKDGKLSLTDANAYLLQEGIEQFEFSLNPRINLLGFKGDPEANYELVVTKEGYQEYRRDFHYNDLIEELDGKPLSVILKAERDNEPALTIMPAEEYYGFFVDFTFPFNLTIDWGDGESEEFNFNEDNLPYPFFGFSHQYEGDLLYPITVTGDLNKIFHFSIDADVTDINLEDLTELVELSVYAANIETLDLSHNNKLRRLDLSRGFVKNVDLGAEHDIRSVVVDRTFQTENIDALIDNIFHHATSKEITGGSFYLLNPALEPSDASLEKLNELQNDYDWTVRLE